MAWQEFTVRKADLLDELSLTQGVVERFIHSTNCAAALCD
jgi:hypothetical protein